MKPSSSLRNSILSGVLMLAAGPPASAGPEDIFLSGSSPIFCCAAAAGTNFLSGQLFQVVDPASALLESFSFWQSTASTGVFRAYLYEWDTGTTRPTGPELFESTPTNAFGVTDTVSGTEHFFDVGDVLLSPSATYIAFVTAIEGSGDTRFLHFSNSGSTAFRFDTATSIGEALGESWSSFPGIDFKFAADFSATPAGGVPEPSVTTLAFVGLLVPGIAVWRRRQRTRAQSGARSGST